MLPTVRIPSHMTSRDVLMPRRQVAGLPQPQPGNVSGEWLDINEGHRKTDKVILYIHGGAFALSSAKSHRPLTTQLASHGSSSLFAINYPLAPENVFPSQLYEAIYAYLNLIDPIDASNKRYDHSQVVFAGDSAGAGLCIALSLWLRDNNFALPSGIVCLSPWLDLLHSQPSWRLADRDYLPTSASGFDPEIVPGCRSHFYTESDRINHNHLVSPLYAKDIPSKPLPPILIHVGNDERLRDENLVFASKTIRSNVSLEVYDDQVHVFQGFSGEATQRSFEKIGEFIKTIDQKPRKAPNEIRRVTSEMKVVDVGTEGALAIVDDGRRTLERLARLKVSRIRSMSNHSVIRTSSVPFLRLI